MGWIIILLMGAALIFGLWRFAGLRGAALQLVGAALLLAMAGYAWQGRPGLPGRAAAETPRPEMPETAFAALRGEFLERFDRASHWLIMADSYQRRGHSEDAVKIIRSGLKASPNNVGLWIGLGNALVIHGGGSMNPAAELAYRRAAALAPEHPAPIFFYGLSLIQGGEVARGEKVWRDLLARAPEDAKWRPLVADRLAILDQLRAMQQSQQGPRPPQ